MEFEEENEEIFNYLSLVEIAQKIVSYFTLSEKKDYPTIQQELSRCCQKIDIVIALETNPNNFLTALFQQKQQLIRLIDVIQNIINEEQQVNMYNWINMNTNGYTNNYKTFTSKKENNGDNIADIIHSIKEIPIIRGLHEIVGLNEVKRNLKSLVILPKTQPQLFLNRQICNSILLYGPPGTGKTKLAHGLAAEANANFLSISAGNILSHYMGQTEKTIKYIFQHLKECSEYTVLFIDEIDGFCRKRTNSEQDHTRRIKTEFMCQMSSTEKSRNVFIICATNCPWDLDTAILRRLHRRIYIPLPNPLERLEMFTFLTNNSNFEDNSKDWSLLIEKTDGYSGSDVFDLVQTALMMPLNELEDTKIWKHCDDGFYEPVLGEQDFSKVICCELVDLPPQSVRSRKARMLDLLNAADSVSCTVTKSDLKKYEIFNRV